MTERPTPEQIEEMRRRDDLMGTHLYDHPPAVYDRRALLAEVDTLTARAVAAEQRAETAELALGRLRDAASVVAENPKYGSALYALDAALSATPTDLAEALRRELRAEGMELAAEMLREGGWEPGAVSARQIDTRAADLKAGR